MGMYLDPGKRRKGYTGTTLSTYEYITRLLAFPLCIMYQITTKEASPECIREPTTAADTVGPVASTQELRGAETVRALLMKWGVR